MNPSGELLLSVWCCPSVFPSVCLSVHLPPLCAIILHSLICRCFLHGWFCLFSGQWLPAARLTRDTEAMKPGRSFRSARGGEPHSYGSQTELDPVMGESNFGGIIIFSLRMKNFKIKAFSKNFLDTSCPSWILTNHYLQEAELRSRAEHALAHWRPAGHSGKCTLRKAKVWGGSPGGSLQGPLETAQMEAQVGRA